MPNTHPTGPNQPPHHKPTDQPKRDEHVASAAPTVSVDEQIFAGNLDALRHHDPNLARLLADLPLPEHVKLARGRDGATTFYLTAPDGPGQWFGRTSMPTVSAPALLANFDPAGANVALAGVGSGLEAALLAHALAAHQAIFVFESDPLKLSLALRLHNLASPIRARRLLLLLADDDDHEPGLLRFCQDHDGFAPPARLLNWPWLDPADRQQFADLLSRVGRTIAARRSQTVAHLRLKAAQLTTPPPLPDRPRLTLLAVSGHYQVTRLGQDLHQAATELGWQTTSVLMDSPANANLLPHSRAAVETEPELLILVDHTRADLPAASQNTPATTWLTPLARPDQRLVNSLKLNDLCVATTAQAERQLLDAGLDQDRLLTLPPAANPARYKDLQPSQDQLEQAHCDVALIAPAANTDPQACGIKLHSHQVLWRKLADLINRNVDQYHDGMLEELLSQAERQSGVKLSEQDVRRQLLDVARMALGPTLQRLAMIQALIDADIQVGLWGPGWGWCSQIGDFWRGSVTSDQHRLAIYRAAKLVLCVEPSGQVGQELLDAIAGRAAVLIKSCPSQSRWDGPAALFDPQTHLASFNDRHRLISLARQLLADPQARTQIAEKAHQHLASQHLYTHRLRTVHQRLAAGDGSGLPRNIPEHR